jgi:hypothetical protein
MEYPLGLNRQTNTWTGLLLQKPPRVILESRSQIQLLYWHEIEFVDIAKAI